MMIDSPKTIEEAVRELTLQEPGSLSAGQAETESDHDVHIIESRIFCVVLVMMYLPTNVILIFWQQN